MRLGRRGDPLLLDRRAAGGRYASDAFPVLSEFFQTWPAARITEVFKLMSFWGLLLEYGPPEPEPDSDEDEGYASSSCARFH